MRGSVAGGIQKIIKEKGLMQKYVAEKSGFTVQQISDMINGRKLILAEHLPKIANALGVSVMDIYIAGETDDRQEAS